MESWDDQQLARLRPMYPGWDIWTVRYSTSRKTAWCARPKGHPVATINVWSPEDLVKAIGEQSA